MLIINLIPKLFLSQNVIDIQNICYKFRIKTEI